MKITGAQAIIKCLENEKVEVIFGYPGAAICPFYDALLDSDIKHILTRHEQGAAHAASGYSRATERVGVCAATSGPGATNLITGIATAYMDSIPMIAITGQVETGLIGRDVFQEVDITGATTPFCKHNYLIKNADDIPRIMKEAFHIASTGRPGPVLIDIPIDMQTTEIDFVYPESVKIKGYKPNYKAHSVQIRKVAQALEEAKKPLICAGGGIISANASEELKELVEKRNIPVATTLMGIGTLPSEHPLNLGMLGSHGTYAANNALHNTDMLLILGARVGDRAMGAAHKIAKRATIVHIDIDPAEIGKNIGTTIPVTGDIKEALVDLRAITVSSGKSEWALEASKNRNKRKRTEIKKDSKTINPAYFLDRLSEIIDEDTVITTEVGQNQIWAANHIKIKTPRTFMTSGGLGTMGYGLPSAVGVKTGRSSAKVILVSGDGSFQMSMQELGTIKQYGLDIKIVLFNNSRLGMVRELQKLKYCSRYSSVVLEDNPNFIKLVEAYGFNGESITMNDGIDDALNRMMASKGPYLLECIVDPEEATL